MAPSDTEAWEFGRLAEEDLPDFTPIPFTLYGYDRKTKEEHAFEFHAKATQPFGSTIDIVRELDNPDPKVHNAAAVRFIEACLEDEDVDSWVEVVHRGPLHFDADALTQMAQKLMDFYMSDEGGDRPPVPRSQRRAGPRRAGGTTTVKHSGRVSTSARSGSAKR